MTLDAGHDGVIQDRPLVHSERQSDGIAVILSSAVAGVRIAGLGGVLPCLAPSLVGGGRAENFKSSSKWRA